MSYEPRALLAPVEETDPAWAGAADVPGMLWRWKWPFAGVFAGCLALAGVYALLAPRLYVAEARLQVERQASPIAPAREPATAGGELLATQAEIVRSPAVVALVARALEPGRSEPPRPDRVAKIIAWLDVVPAVDASVLVIRYQAAEEASSVRVCGLIVDKYQEYLKQREAGSQVQLLRVVSQKEADLRRQLDALDEKYAELRKSNPLVGDSTSALAMQRDRLNQLAEARTQAQLKRVDLETRQRSLARSNDPVAAASQMSAATQKRVSAAAMPPTLTSEVNMIQEELLRTQVQEQRLLQQYLPEHPDILTARKTITALERRLDEVNDKARRLLDDELDAAQAQESELEALYKQEFEKTKALETYQVKERQLVADIDRVRQLYGAMAGQVHLANQAAGAGDAPLRVTVLQQPLTAQATIFPPSPLLLSLSVLVGLCGGLGLVVLLDRHGLRLDVPGVLQSRLKLPVFAMIPGIDVPRQAPSRALVYARQVCRQPHSPMAEAFHQLRARLLGCSETEHGLVVQLASPIEGEGKTTVAANLAASFAQAGKKVLVVDTDLQRGMLHQVFDVPNRVGLSSLLLDELPIEQAVLRSPLVPVDVLPCGPQRGNPAELLARVRFLRLLEWMRLAYDVVILDGPPLLGQRGTLVLAPGADGIVLTLRVAQSSLGSASRACQLLDVIQRKPWGIVVTQAPGVGGAAKDVPPPMIEVGASPPPGPGGT